MWIKIWGASVGKQVFRAGRHVKARPYDDEGRAMNLQLIPFLAKMEVWSPSKLKSRHKVAER